MGCGDTSMMIRKHGNIKQADSFIFSANPAWPHLIRLALVIALAYMLLPD